jgi:hypothetical protein
MDVGVKSPTYTPFSVTYLEHLALSRSDAQREVRSDVRRSVPPSFMRNAAASQHPHPAGGGHGTPALQRKGSSSSTMRSNDGRGPTVASLPTSASAASLRSTKRSQRPSSAAPLPFRTVSQWTGVAAARSDPNAHTTPAPRPERAGGADRSSAGPETHAGGSRQPLWASLGHEGQAPPLDIPPRADSVDVSLWLNSEDGGDAASLVEVEPVHVHVPALAATAPTPHSEQKRRPQSAASFGRRPKTPVSRHPAGPLVSPEGVRQLHYLDGIVVRMGAPLPRKCPCLAVRGAVVRRGRHRGIVFGVRGDVTVAAADKILH